MRFFDTRNKYEWSDWFAWYPIKVNLGNGKSVWIWCEWVQRRWQMYYDGVATVIRNKDGTDLSDD